MPRGVVKATRRTRPKVTTTDHGPSDSNVAPLLLLSAGGDSNDGVALLSQQQGDSIVVVRKADSEQQQGRNAAVSGRDRGALLGFCRAGGHDAAGVLDDGVDDLAGLVAGAGGGHLSGALADH